MAETVEELGSGNRRRNNGINEAANPNNCCEFCRLRESILLGSASKIVLQQPRLKADIPHGLADVRYWG
jgi:hypothetical protein